MVQETKKGTFIAKALAKSAVLHSFTSKDQSTLDLLPNNEAFEVSSLAGDDEIASTSSSRHGCDGTQRSHDVEFWVDHLFRFNDWCGTTGAQSAHQYRPDRPHRTLPLQRHDHRFQSSPFSYESRQNSILQ